MDVSLKGTSVEPDADDMEAAYGEGTTPADVLTVRTLWPCWQRVHAAWSNGVHVGKQSVRGTHMRRRALRQPLHLRTRLACC